MDRSAQRKPSALLRCSVPFSMEREEVMRCHATPPHGVLASQILLVAEQRDVPLMCGDCRSRCRNNSCGNRLVGITRMSLLTSSVKYRQHLWIAVLSSVDTVGRMGGGVVRRPWRSTPGRDP